MYISEFEQVIIHKCVHTCTFLKMNRQVIKTKIARMNKK